MKKVMVRAWEIAKEAVQKFGGKVKEFFQQALIIAWSEIKNGVKMVELKGSEKQITWAEEIRENIINLSIKVIETKKEMWLSRGMDESLIAKKCVKPMQFVEMLKSNDDAKWFIDNFKFVAQRKYDMYHFVAQMKTFDEAKKLNMDVIVQGIEY